MKVPSSSLYKVTGYFKYGLFKRKKRNFECYVVCRHIREIQDKILKQAGKKYKIAIINDIQFILTTKVSKKKKDIFKLLII